MEHGRKLPWRSTRDPYLLAVAEVLLQKTKGPDAARVWQCLVEMYPSACELADADPTAVRETVAGLGLGDQRTARLQALAAALCQGARGKLPALGPYGSAITTLASGREPETQPVDGNVARVITRLYGLSFERGEPRKKPAVKNAVTAMLDTRQRAPDKLEVAYGLVDLGAAICTPHRPACERCPLSTWCVSATIRA